MSLHDYRDLSVRLATAEREVKRLRALAQDVLDALNAEKHPDIDEGYDLALVAALSMLGKEMKPEGGRMVPLHELVASDILRVALTEEDSP